MTLLIMMFEPWPAIHLVSLDLFISVFYPNSSKVSVTVMLHTDAKTSSFFSPGMTLSQTSGKRWLHCPGRSTQRQPQCAEARCMCSGVWTRLDAQRVCCSPTYRRATLGVSLNHQWSVRQVTTPTVFCRILSHTLEQDVMSSGDMLPLLPLPFVFWESYCWILCTILWFDIPKCVVCFPSLCLCISHFKENNPPTS